MITAYKENTTEEKVEETIRVPLCKYCITKTKAYGDYISVGHITKARKCYFCDDTDIPLYICEVEP